MRFEVKTKQADECREVLKGFCEKLSEEYEKQIMEAPKMARNMMPFMSATLEETGRGFVVVIPLELPFGLNAVMFGIRRKMVRQLEGYLKEKKIKAKVKYIGK